MIVYLHKPSFFYRQFKGTEQNGGYQQPRLTASALARMQQLQQQGGPETTSAAALPSSTTRSLYDVKAMQKEAVLSYVKVINDV